MQTWYNSVPASFKEGTMMCGLDWGLSLISSESFLFCSRREARTVGFPCVCGPPTECIPHTAAAPVSVSATRFVGCLFCTLVCYNFPRVYMDC